jgi:hypothetical protein
MGTYEFEQLARLESGKHSCRQPTFGDQTWPARRPITRKDGAPLGSVAELIRP